MNRNRTFAATITFFAVLALALVTFFAMSGGGTDDALAPTATTKQQLTVKVRDTNQQAMSGVAVRLVDSTNQKVVDGTTTSTGEVVLSFEPKAGSYAVIATEPTGYRAQDDKDGGSSHLGDPTCDHVHLCIYLTASAAQDGSVTVEIDDIASGQESELDDLWFEMAPPTAGTDDEAGVSLGGDDDVLIGETGGGDLLLDPQPPAVPGIAQLCVDVRHQPVPDQNAASGIWVRGEVYGLDGGWIWVQGPTLNGGDPIQLPVSGGLFEGPLGINSYGDHPIDRFELADPAGDIAPVDLLPQLAAGPGTLVTVTGDEGPAFDSECFDLEPPVVDEEPIAESSDDGDQADTTAEELAASRELEAANRVDDFLSTFVADHVDGDVDGLLETLHPAIPLAFGETACGEYVARTTGSLVGAERLSVGQLTDVDLDTPSGPITITDVIPFEVEFTLVDGSTMTNEANLAVLDGEPHWLTRCGL